MNPKPELLSLVNPFWKPDLSACVVLLIPVLTIVTFVYRYYARRYTSPLSIAPIAHTDLFLLKYFGLIPPPRENEKTDTFSHFLIQASRNSNIYPISVCWSITGKPLVIVNTLKGIKDVLLDGQARDKVNKKAPPKVQRGNLIRFIQNLVFGGKNLNNSIEEDWRWRRHVLLPPFQPKQLVPRLLPYVAARTGELLSLFGQHAENGTPVELDELFMDVTMDVINYCLYGRTELNYDLVGGKINLKNKHSQLGQGFQSIDVWLPFGLNKTEWAQRAYKPARDALISFIDDSLLRALEDHKELIQKFDKESVPESERYYNSVAATAYSSGLYDKDRKELAIEFLSLTFAGHDTTAHTLAFAFSEIARSPKLQDELFKQVRDVLGPPPVAPESITSEKLARMPLVTAVYRETLRKYPAVVFIPVHVNSDIIVDGVVVPADAEIWNNVRGVQMDPRYFPDPERFDPYRWMRPEENAMDDGFDYMTANNKSAATSSEITSDTQYNFPDLSFTLGQHACIGKNLAILELRTVIASTMNQFTCSLKEGSVIDTKIVLTTKPRFGVWTHFQKREQ